MITSIIYYIEPVLSKSILKIYRNLVKYESKIQFIFFINTVYIAYWIGQLNNDFSLTYEKCTLFFVGGLLYNIVLYLLKKLAKWVALVMKVVFFIMVVLSILRGLYLLYGYIQRQFFQFS